LNPSLIGLTTSPTSSVSSSLAGREILDGLLGVVEPGVNLGEGGAFMFGLITGLVGE
jgi:hypothetical protein